MKRRNPHRSATGAARTPRPLLHVDVIRSTEELDFDAWALTYVRAVRAAMAREAAQQQADAARVPASARRPGEAAA